VVDAEIDIVCFAFAAVGLELIVGKDLALEWVALHFDDF